MFYPQNLIDTCWNKTLFAVSKYPRKCSKCLFLLQVTLTHRFNPIKYPSCCLLQGKPQTVMLIWQVWALATLPCWQSCHSSCFVLFYWATFPSDARHLGMHKLTFHFSTRTCVLWKASRRVSRIVWKSDFGRTGLRFEIANDRISCSGRRRWKTGKASVSSLSSTRLTLGYLLSYIIDLLPNSWWPEIEKRVPWDITDATQV